MLKVAERTTNAVIKQPKLLKLLKVIMLLSDKHGASLSSVSWHLDVSKRTGHRYLSLITEAGFVIEKETHYMKSTQARVKYRITAWPPELANLKMLCAA